jgi:hypothetical protein
MDALGREDVMACMCGDANCPSCGLAQGTLDRGEDIAYWTCLDDIEHLHCETLDEAVEEYLDGLAPTPGSVDPEDFFRDLPDVKCTAWVRRVIDRKWLADSVLDYALEQIGDVHGNPDGDEPATDAIKAAALAFADAFIADFAVWACEPAGSEEVNALEWVKKHAPHWLAERGT